MSLRHSMSERYPKKVFKTYDVAKTTFTLILDVVGMSLGRTNDVC